MGRGGNCKVELFNDITPSDFILRIIVYDPGPALFVISRGEGAQLDI